MNDPRSRCGLNRPGVFRAVLLVLLIQLAPSTAHAVQTDIPTRIRAYLEGLGAGAVPVIEGRTLNEPGLLVQTYLAREHQPIWMPVAETGLEASQMLQAIERSQAHGFNPERYHRSAIEALLQQPGDESALPLELLLTDAFLSQAQHRSRGAVLPVDLDPAWQLPQPEVDAPALLQETAQRQADAEEVLELLWPGDEEYARLLNRRAELVAMHEETSEPIAAGPLLRPGQSSERVVALKRRLLGPGEYSTLYDETLEREVKAFQRSAGLEPDGIVGENTLEILNMTRVSWIDRLDANLERWRWLPRNTPDTYIRVNIAAFMLRVIENGATAWTMNVIVGKPYRETPVFTETIKYLVFNPYWNVPFSIATKDKLPLLKADAVALAEKGYEAKSQGGEAFVPVDAIDWSGVTARNFSFLLRQRPGVDNALGRVKFMLPNPWAVYLHDTPTIELFARMERSFSSGCIRLEQPLKLAAWMLNREGRPEAGELQAMIESGVTQTIYLQDPVPVYIVYFTAFADEDQGVVFRRDVYGRDRKLVEALRK